MISTILSFIKNPTRIITYLLMGALVVLGSMYAWEVVDNGSLTSQLESQKLETQKALDAEGSCKRTLKKMIESNKKKHRVLKAYKNKIQGVKDNDKKVHNVTDFIDYSKWLQ